VLDFTMRAIQADLDGLAARQRILAQNIANADTPGYLAGEVNFESSLQDAISTGDPSQTQITTSTSTAPTNQNGNNVSIDDANVSLIDTGLRYQLATEMMNNKFRLITDALKSS
jgi:flagellar basal-body rod protein FlgB